MSLFKKAQNAILSTVSKRQKGSSLSTSSSSSSKIPPAFSPGLESKTIGLEAQANMTHIYYKSSNDYLVSAQNYRGQDDLYTARKIYLQGLQTISSDDPEYISIVKEKEKVEAMLEQRSKGGFYNLLPYDVLYMIFGHLGYKDLLHCAQVCRQWFDFMWEWSEFWNKLTSEIPSMDKLTMGSLIHHQTEELCLDRPSNPDLIHDIFLLLSLWENESSIKKIYLQNLTMSNSDVRMMGSAITSMSSSLNQIELTNCAVKNDDIMQYILPVCSSGLTHVSFSHNNSPVASQNDSCKDLCHSHHTNSHQNSSSNYFTIRLHRTPPKRTALTSVIDYSALTCLFLDKPNQNTTSYPQFNNDTKFCEQFMILIQKCPNLIHLFLTNYSGRDQSLGSCLQQVTKSCPRLINLVVSKNACMPHTIISNIYYNEYGLQPITSSSSSSSSKEISYKGYKTPIRTEKESTRNASNLRRLVLTQYDAYSALRKEHIFTLFKKYHASMELLYLDYDSTAIGRITLGKLASHGCPKLREFRLSTDRNSLGGGSVKPPMSTILVRLFSVCPALEVIELEEVNTGRYRYLQLDACVVETIAKKCPQLRHLHFIDFPSKPYNPESSCKAFLSFIDNNIKSNVSSNVRNDGSKIAKWKNIEKVKAPSQLECLKVTEISHGTAHALVTNLASLKYLQIALWAEKAEEETKLIDKEDMVQQIKNILEERGGSLTITPHRRNPSNR